MREYDAVVVGSGPNGLSAANALAERGWSVLVFEGQAVAGGAMQTEGLTLPGFRHDTFSAVYPAAAASPVFQRWNLERFGLTWIHPGIALAHPLEGGDCVSLHRDLVSTAESLNRRRRRSLG
jgi:phytoene dehydrogenase-like protein